MENKSIVHEVTRYRVKVKRNGKSVIDLPGILCLPGLLTAPRLSIAGMIAAPLLGYSVHLEDEDGKAVDVENTMRKAAETIRETAAGTARMIKSEIDKAWQEISADDPESGESEEAESAETAAVPDTDPGEEITEDLKSHKEDSIPTIQATPDDSAEE